jgi:hypothetical protein
MALKLGHMDQN